MTVDRYDADQQILAAQCQEGLNDLIEATGKAIRPALIKPGQPDPDKPEAVMARGAKALTEWTHLVRQALMVGGSKMGEGVVSPPTYALLCGLILGEITAVADALNDPIPDEVEGQLSEVFEGASILGRLKFEEGIKRGVVGVEKGEDGTIKVTYGGNRLH